LKKNLFPGDPHFQHGEVPAVGILVANLGTPDAPTRPALRRYLKEFLSDPRVIELSRPFWWLILNGIILNTRPREVAKLYHEIWTEEGSPLLAITRKQAHALEATLRREVGSPLHTAVGMRYGNPSIASALRELRKKGCRRILVLPMYPQYAAATTASTFDAVTAELQTWRWVPELRTIHTYHDHPGYTAALAASIREVWERDGEPEKLVFSFHGIPQRYFDDGDPYHCLCHKSARLTAEALGLPQERYVVSFQSLFGKEEWIKPYTDVTIRALGKSGVKRLDVICPGFAADCLETLEEIDGQNREFFLESGGEKFRYIPALNDRTDHIEALAALTLEHLQGWVTPASEWDAAAVQGEAEASRERGEAMAANPPVADGGF
jgi:ferrochelatase